MSALTISKHRDNLDAELFAEHRRNIFIQVDRMFAGLMMLQWVAGIVAALVISPKTWSGASSSIHPHVWAAFIIGGAAASVPIFMVLRHPGETLTRHMVAVGQMIQSALLIDLLGGRIETHFHVFVSLAFLSLYRDWKVLIPATLVVAGDHLLRGIYFPQSVYGVASASIWRTFEHAGWVIFEDIVLVTACIRSEREMRQIAERIQQGEDRTRLILETVLDGLITIDQDGRITSWNFNAEKLFGWTAEQVVGQSLEEKILSPRQREKHPAGLTQLVDDGQACTLNRRLEITAARENGTEFPAELAIAAMRTGGKTNFSVFVRDISQRKEAEEAIRRAKDIAEDANRSKSAFLANMSHEIRTPMSAIVGYADLMLDPARSMSDRQDSLQVIRRNARHLLQLINDILDISKIEAGKMSIERIECDLPITVAEVLSMIRPRAVEKAITFEHCFDGPIPRVIRTDPLRLKQILTNLLGNAIKFTTSGKVTLRVTLETKNDQNFIRFDVADTGVGMTPEQMSRLFQPFGQADESTTRKFGGTGLGLVISKRLATLLGGEIWVESTSMIGSVFHATIDAGLLAGAEMISEMHEGLLAAPAKPREEPAQIRLSGRILLAEDGMDNQILFCLHLREAGAEVVVAENGRLAVGLARTQPFDLILMDMQMPELDGYGAASELRRRGFTLPIIALTAHAMSGDREKCINAGCTDYLTKPIERGELLRMISQYLQKPPAGATGAPVLAPLPAAPPSTHESEMREIVTKFIERLPKRVDDLAELMAKGNLTELQRAVHQLKGAGKGYGFPSISELAGRAEQYVKEQAQLETIQTAVDELIGVIRDVDGYQHQKEHSDDAAR